jgi:hypothetical protein
MTDRRLHAVPTEPIAMPQIADMPGAYTVRRSGRDTAEAIVHQGNTGDWYVMYSPTPGEPAIAHQWRGSAVLPARLDQLAAGRAALELVDAAALGVPYWPEFLARALMAGEPVESIARLHAPVNCDDRYVGCAGDGSAYEWHECPTVRLLAGSFGLDRLARGH